MPVSKDQARELAKSFRDFSVALGDYRFANWGSLTAAQRQKLEDLEWTLLNTSSDLVTTAVGLALDDVQADLEALTRATSRARAALKTVQDVKNVLSIAAGVLALGGAIVAAVVSKDPAPVLAAAGGLAGTLKGLATGGS